MDFFNDLPVRKKLMRAFMVISVSVLALTCSAYFTYEFFTFRMTMVRQVTVLGKIIAANSTAALAFDSREDANEILSSVRVQPHIVAAGIYDKQGHLFAFYPRSLSADAFPKAPKAGGYRFKDTYLEGFQPVVQGDDHLGTLYIQSDLGAMYDRFKLYAVIAVLVIAVSLVLAYLLSSRMQRSVTKPVLALAGTAQVVSDRRDYSVRAIKFGNDELGLLTDTFNHMLTEIEQQNREIQQFNNQLKKRIEERTRQLKMANKELESFSYSVSHDLRAPLRSIAGYSGILLEDYADKLDDQGKEVLDVVIRNAGKMGKLIDDLLAFSRAGKRSLQKSNLDMYALTIGIVDELKARQPTSAEIIVRQMLPAQGDEGMMRQVMTNLISNALKYSGKTEKPVIEIGSYVRDSSKVYYVKDNGAGFDMQYVDKLFGVFQRLHGENEFEGTGVGLALVYRIISKHGGKTWAEGSVGEGAVFYFSLPASDLAVENDVGRES